MSDRRYSEKEMRAIFERAARRATAAPQEGEGGLTLAELQEIGTAAGLDPADVAAAARDLHAPAAPRRRILGFTRDVTRTRHLSGPVSEDAWGQIVAELRRHAGADGVLASVGRVRSWTSSLKDEEVPLRASLEPDGQGDCLTLTQRAGDLAAILTTIPAGLLVLIGGVIAATKGKPLALLAVLSGLMIHFGIRMVYERWVRREGTRFDGLLDRAEALARTDPEAERLASEGQRTPAVPLLPLDDDPADADASARLRTRA